MADDLKKTIADTEQLETALAKSNITLGMVEKAQIKLTKSLYNAPFVKTGIAVGTVMVGLNKLFKVQNHNRKAREEGNQTINEEGTVLMKAVAMMTAYGGAAKLAGKGTTNLGKAMFSLTSSVLFLFGIFGLLALAAMALAVAFADVNSPLMSWLTDMPVVGDLMNGLKIVMTGEDGESGLKGAVDVLALALVAGSLAFLVFGAPIGVLVATVIGVVGIFKWMKNKTGSTVAAIIAAGAVLMVGVTAFIATISTTVAGAVAPFLLPFALILAGVTGVWLSLTGEINYWWGVISSIFIVIGSALLYAAIFGLAAISWPVVALIALGAAIIFTIVKYWDEIVAFFVAAYDWVVGWINTIGSWIGEKWDGFWSWMGGIWTSVGNFFGGIKDWIMGIPGWIGSQFSKLGSAVSNGITSVKDKAMAIVNTIIGFFSGLWKNVKAFPGKVKDMFMKIVRMPAQGFVHLWNKKIAGIIPKMKIPKWVPALGGKSFGPFPKKMKMFADGGLVQNPTLGMVGEAVPEAVIPLKGGRVPVQLGGAQYSDAAMRRMVDAVSPAVKEHGNTYNLNIEVSGVIATSEKAKRELANDIGEVIMKEMMNKMTGNSRFMKKVGSWF